MTEVETSLLRGSATEAFKQLLISGNALVFLDPEGGMKVWRLDKYVVKRDPKGRVLEIIIHEKVSKQDLPEETRAAVERQYPLTVNPSNPANDEVALYTWIRRESERFVVHQEAEDIVVAGSKVIICLPHTVAGLTLDQGGR